MTHPLSIDSQSSSTGSDGCLFALCGFGFAAVGPTDDSGVVTVGLGAGSVCAATCAGGARAVSAGLLVGAIGEGDSDALGPSPSPSLDVYLSTIDCSAGRSSFAS